MTILKRIVRGLRVLVRSSSVERELDEEIRLHLELETEKNLRAGLSPGEARRQARLAFGSVEVAKETYREGWGLAWLRDAASDARFAVRALRRNPVLAAAAVVTLAIGIGANTAIFSAVNAVILRPLPFPRADRLVMLWESNPDFNWHEATAAPANFLDWRERVPAFADVAAYAGFLPSTTLTGEGRPRLLKSAVVTGNFFSVLGVHAEVGRMLRDGETWQAGGSVGSTGGRPQQVAIISDRVWRQSFGADPGIVGRTVTLDGEPVQVVGVAPAWFGFPSEDIDVWTPFGWDPTNRTKASFRRAHWVRVVGRLKPGVSVATADAQLQVVVKRLQREYPTLNHHMGAGMTPLHAFLVRETRRPLIILLSAVGLLLLIACANVGNLLLVRAADRERETALRLTLGAGKGRLVRQVLTESTVLSLIGGLAGLAVGWWGTRALVTLQPEGMLPIHDIRMDWGVLAYVLAISTASGVLFGIAPALWSGRRVPAEVLREGGRGAAGRRVHRWGNALVVAEVAIALLLAVGAGLLVRSFWLLEQVDPGFDPHGMLTVELAPQGDRYDTGDKLIAFYNALVTRARGLPGVTSAAATSEVPLTSWGWTSQFTAIGWAPDHYGDEVAYGEVTPGYFRTMHVPILRGRALTPRDDQNAPMVVVINETLAKEYFPGQDPIGQRVAFDKVPDSTSVWRTIVGIVGDEHQTELGVDTKAQFIAPYAQEPRTRMFLVMRTTGDPTTLGPSVRNLVAQLDPDLAIVSMRTMDEVRAASLARQRFLMTMLLVFAGAGLLLAVIGVYGVMAQLARRRTREMGIRLALGAEGAQVRWLVVRHGLGLVVLGLGIGLAAALLATRAMRAFLYHVTPADPATFIGVPLLLVLTALAATWIPALRASHTDPAATLRED
jgi:putative ABC transport system permease protein